MEQIKISKGFNTPLAGMPDIGIVEFSDSPTLGLSAMDVPYIRPKLLVKEGDRVKTGTPLFFDKRDPSIQFVSPGTGVVEKIVFGERRQLHEVVIGPEGQDEFVEFEPFSQSYLSAVSRDDLVNRLKQGGLWQALRQFPEKDTADAAHTPAMIIVSLWGSDIFSPDPGVVVERDAAAFEFGLEVLKRFTDRVVVTVKAGSLDRLPRVKPLITHTVPDIYPAWNPGAVLYHLKKDSRENSSWCIAADHLIMAAKFLMTGCYPTEKIITVTRGREHRPHVLTRQGARLERVLGDFKEGEIVTTGRFDGRKVEPESHLGFFDNTLNIVATPDQDEMFGFLRPGKAKATASRAFLSCLFSEPKETDASLHGELRPCINCSYCENICPNDLMPSFIMKELLSDGIEDALACGLLDCCQCGLCSYVCPSKIELARILADGMDALYKDKQG
ncbi:MAG: Na(+)-translocating NADH-quinone reductase subunit A [Desulfobacterium sp.]|jgi:Na+-transporting NADH:ubiquinone oxidoreductase subunit A|nr:Na(+)-translocating NADH-quinone reductase subunit A [Desulfobacterium sp.]